MNLFAYLSDPANWQGPDGIWNLLLQHLGYTVAAVGIAAVIAIPLGIFIGHTGRGSFLLIGLSNAARAIPTLGLLVLVVLLLGTGTGPIIGVLAILALPPILTATAAGVRGADHEAVHAARAIGIDPWSVKLGAITLSAAFMGAGGAFYVQVFQYIDPGLAFGPVSSVEALVAAIVGGMGTLWGPVLGAAVLHLLGEFTRNLFGQLPGLNMIVYGSVLVLIVMFVPRGLSGAGRSLRDVLRGRRG